MWLSQSPKKRLVLDIMKMKVNFMKMKVNFMKTITNEVIKIETQKMGALLEK
jgi:hypothetical protein